MEDLLIDVHKSEAYVESDYAYYSKNKRKDSIENAVFAKHGVTRATFDTSLIWYGNNIEKYIQIYRNVIVRLQEEDNRTLALMNDDKDVINKITRSGDTVNIWNREPCYVFEGRVGRNLLAFSVPSDDNFKEGDVFRFKFRLDRLTDETFIYRPQVTLAVKGNNDSIRFVTKDISHTGWDSLTIHSFGTIRSVTGSIFVPPMPEWRVIYADSISLIRMHKPSAQ